MPAPQLFDPAAYVRMIALLASSGWLLVTLGIWGACGWWWVWPLSVGVALLAVGAGYGWSLWRQLLAKAGKAEGPRSIEGYENPGRRSA